jgi:hypothetical protein
LTWTMTKLQTVASRRLLKRWPTSREKLVFFANKNQLERELAAWFLWQEFHSGHESSAAGWKNQNTILEAMRYYLDKSMKLMPGGHRWSRHEDNEVTNKEEEKKTRGLPWW